LSQGELDIGVVSETREYEIVLEKVYRGYDLSYSSERAISFANLPEPNGPTLVGFINKAPFPAGDFLCASRKVDQYELLLTLMTLWLSSFSQNRAYQQMIVLLSDE
jgi:hypothetical protein